MKKGLKKKIWIAAAVLVAALMAALYVPIRSNYEQTLNALVFKCDENGEILDEVPVEEITVQVDANRHKFLLSERQTVSGSVEFSAYYKAKNGREENVVFVLESRYAKPLAENEDMAKAPIEGDDQTRSEEMKSESGEYLICNQIYYQDNNAYEFGVAYKDPADIPIYREMKYSEEFDKLIWTDYENGYVYLCAAEEVDVAALLAYFATDAI